MIIRFFEWKYEDGTVGYGASTTNGDENTADCYCSSNPANWWEWDVSIVTREPAQKIRLQRKLAALWQLMNMPETNSIVIDFIELRK